MTCIRTKPTTAAVTVAIRALGTRQEIVESMVDPAGMQINCRMMSFHKPVRLLAFLSVKSSRIGRNSKGLTT